ncbi:MAG TPA: pyridoxal phosphate-dependent aminotransferase [Terriglobales bacterium]
MAAGAQLKTGLTERINRIEASATMAVANEADRMRKAGADLVDFGAGEPHFHTPQHIKDAAIAAIQANFTKYTAVAGIVELRDAIAARHAADFGSAYKREEVIASTGGKQALFNAFQVLIEHGDEVIIPTPAWVSFKDIVGYAGGKSVFVPTDEANGFALSQEMIERAITPATRAIILNSPTNPSGAVIDPEVFTSIVRMAAKRDIWVICDECYVYLDYSGRRFSGGSVTDAKERLVIIGSLSKTYAMTGWRLGYALAPASVTSATAKLQSQSTSNPTSIVQKAAIAALTGPQDCLKEMCDEYIRLRDRMVSGLRAIPGIQCNMPQGAFYAYPNVSAFFGRKGINSASDVAGKLLREAGVVTVPGEAFGTAQHIRFSYPTKPEEIDRGLERMKKFFGSLE